MPSFYILLSCFSSSVDILFKMQCHVNLVIGNKFLIFFMAFKFVLNFSIGSKLSWEQVSMQSRVSWTLQVGISNLSSTSHQQKLEYWQLEQLCTYIIFLLHYFDTFEEFFISFISADLWYGYSSLFRVKNLYILITHCLLHCWIASIYKSFFPCTYCFLFITFNLNPHFLKSDFDLDYSRYNL